MWFTRVMHTKTDLLRALGYLAYIYASSHNSLIHFSYVKEKGEERDEIALRDN